MIGFEAIILYLIPNGINYNWKSIVHILVDQKMKNKQTKRIKNWIIVFVYVGVKYRERERERECVRVKENERDRVINLAFFFIILYEY